MCLLGRYLSSGTIKTGIFTQVFRSIVRSNKTSHALHRYRCQIERIRTVIGDVTELI